MYGKWIPCSVERPKNSEHDWVLGQIREKDTGYLWIPKVVEYRENLDDWYCDELGWLKQSPVANNRFEVVAWMPLPPLYNPE